MTRSFRRFLFLALLLPSTASPLAAQGEPAPGGSDDATRACVAKEIDDLLVLYKHLHTHPELSFDETETEKKIADALRAVGCEVTTGIGGHGLVGKMTNGDGPVVMVRTDLDALPIVENTGLEYSSKVRVRSKDGKETGAMHACGHDVHMTVFIGTARALAQTKSEWKGTILFVGQPAEERGKGALSMITDGLFTRFPRPARALALHCSATLPAGQVSYCEGYALASVDSVDLLVRGVGGHGAYPQATKDPVVLAAEIVLALQTLTSREKSPFEPAVLTVGSIHGGTKHNIISDEVKLEITCRSYSDDVRNALIEGIKRKARGCAIAAGVPDDRMPIVTVLDESIPPTYNDPELTRLIAGSISDAIGKSFVRKAECVMGGEDFGCFGRVEPKIPISMFWLGAVSQKAFDAAAAAKKSLPSLHSAEFAPDAKLTIETGVRAMTAAVRCALKLK